MFLLRNYNYIPAKGNRSRGALNGVFYLFLSLSPPINCGAGYVLPVMDYYPEEHKAE